ncbi:MAG: hypothetical protein ACRDGN_12285 [bacterium]
MDAPTASPLDRRGLLIVSLPRNDAALARAAAEAGADMLKVHINVRHRASGTRFRSLDEEEEDLTAVLAAGLPTGLVPGEETMVTREEIPRLKRFAFLDAYITRLPAFLYDAGVPVIPAIPHDYPPEALGAIRAFPGDWLEAALVPPEGYGLEPAAGDLGALARLGSATGRRLIVPSQRRIGPENLARYFAIPQVWAVMIGVVVAGRTPETIGRATTAFRRATDGLFA